MKSTYHHFDIENEPDFDVNESLKHQTPLQLNHAGISLLPVLHSYLLEHVHEFCLALRAEMPVFPELPELLADNSLAERLITEQVAFFFEITAGNYGEEYSRRRMENAGRYCRLGLYPQWYLGCYHAYLSRVLSLLSRLFGCDTEQFTAAYNALLKIVMFDILLAADANSCAEKQVVNRLKQHLGDLMEGIDAIIWEADLATLACRYVSPQAERLGYPLKRWLDEPNFWSSIIHAEDRKATLEFTTREIAAGRNHNMEYRLLAADGRTLWVHEKVTISEQLGCLRGVIVDITAIKETEDRLAHDDLTGLPNRNLLEDRITQAIAYADRNGKMLAILLIDLDRFKYVNDSLGHNIGDKVLQTAAERLIGNLRGADTVARLGGDEFVVILTDLNKPDNAGGKAQNILDSMSTPFSIGTHNFFLSASIGVSIYPQDGDTPQTLLKNADIAMYRAKDNGKNCFVFYTDNMNAATARQLYMENQMRLALERDEFILYYQPQADLETGHIIGVEALVRWQHPEMGLVPPNQFIKIAEDTGLIVPLGEWILETACRQAVLWQAKGLPKLRMAVNLSVRQFMQYDLVGTVARILKKTSLDPKLLELELTESILMKGVSESIETLLRLRKMGICLSVDDFGTGYSSLSYLSRFPVTAVKIDQSFVRDIASDPSAATLVRSIISMAHELHLRVIAEGVETEGQLSFIVNHRCNEVQGYYLSRPMPADAFFAMFREFPGLKIRYGAKKAPERTLLLVDDEKNILSALKRELHGFGYRILTANNALKAFELLAIHPVGVIISDQRMPEVTGIEFLHRVKDLYPNTIRIILSGYSDIQSITDAINQGAIYKYLEKPWEETLLRDTVGDAFQQYELKQENARLGRELEIANSHLSEINRDLELRISEKTQEISQNLNILQISQEVLEFLPTAVIGIDDDGLIVMANREANLIFSDDGAGPLISCEASSRLPEIFLDCSADCSETGQILKMANGRCFRIIRYRLGEFCKSKGTVFVILPIEGFD